MNINNCVNEIEVKNFLEQFLKNRQDKISEDTLLSERKIKQPSIILFEDEEVLSQRKPFITCQGPDLEFEGRYLFCKYYNEKRTI